MACIQGTLTASVFDPKLYLVGACGLNPSLAHLQISLAILHILQRLSAFKSHPDQVNTGLLQKVQRLLMAKRKREAEVPT